ncbi:MAG: hypothetical protein JO031_10775, partial [Ktedonobacteraceae bacterium]|nr:hypothetical protein [Ktedonobacteraceae bacterium]
MNKSLPRFGGEMENIRMTVEVDPNPLDIQTVEQGLRSYGEAIVKLMDMKGLNIFLRDDNNQIVGGLLGLTKRGWLEIGTLWVREDM